MPFKLKIPPIKTCTLKKVRYHTVREAENAINMLIWRCEANRKAGELVAYKCQECQAWHVGHRL